MRPLIENKKARLEYELVEEYEAGIELRGFEAKAARAGMGSLAGARVLVLEKNATPGGISICSAGGLRVAEDEEAAVVHEVFLRPRDATGRRLASPARSGGSPAARKGGGLGESGGVDHLAQLGGCRCRIQVEIGRQGSVRFFCHVSCASVKSPVWRVITGFVAHPGQSVNHYLAAHLFSAAVRIVRNV